MSITCTFPKGYSTSLRHLVVHGILVSDGKILLEKRHPDIAEGNLWSLPGGYVQRDETAKEAIVRETLEETGWSTRVLYVLRLSANPHRRHDALWQNIGIDYVLEAIHKEKDGDWESSEVTWFSLDNLPDSQMFAFDHFEIISLYKQFLDGKVSVPFFDD